MSLCELILCVEQRTLRAQHLEEVREPRLEPLLREICGAHGIDAIVLRFPLTYGPGVKGNFLALVQAVAQERRLPLAGIVNRRSLLYLGNAVSAIEAALVAPTLTDEALPVADAKSVSTPELVTKLALALRLQSRLYHVPAPLLRAGAAERAWRSGGGGLAGTPVPAQRDQDNRDEQHGGDREAGGARLAERSLLLLRGRCRRLLLVA